MLDEVNTATKFLKSLLMCQPPKIISQTELENFSNKLQDILVTRFQSHWYPDLPNKGSGYRCIRINRKMDPIILQACKEAGLETKIPTLLPPELTIWIDPLEVAYRFGEEGSICKLDLFTPPTSPKQTSPATSPVATRKEDNSLPQLVSGRQRSTKKKGQKKFMLVTSPTTQRHSLQTTQLPNTYFQSHTTQRSPKLAPSMSEFSFPTITVNA